MINRLKQGFTLLEVMIATIILSAGLVILLTSFMQCQQVMTASQSYENAQYVLILGETVHPLPDADMVTTDPIDDEKLNIEEVDALELYDKLELDPLPRDRELELETYTFQRHVDEIDDEELKRSGYIYTIRTTVSWGRDTMNSDRQNVQIITFWRKKK